MTGDNIEPKASQPEQVEMAGGLDYEKSAGTGFNDKILNEEARLGAEAEHSLGLIQAIKTYKRAAMWSICEYLVSAT
jgi:SP family general alpha glucoside:H+ symporter-like MFS transporter